MRDQEVEEWNEAGDRQEDGEGEGDGALGEAGRTDFQGGLFLAGEGLVGLGLLHRSENEVDEGVVILGCHQEERGDSADGSPDDLRCRDVAGPVPGLGGKECDDGGEYEGAEVIGGLDEGGDEFGVPGGLVGWQQGVEVLEGLGKGVGAEENPCEGHREEGEGHGEESGDSECGEVLGLESFEGEEAAVDAAPEEEGPRRAVPETAKEHGEEKVCVGACVTKAIAAERDVEVFAKPGREGDVPSAPEVGEGGCEVGGIEVFGEEESEHESESDGHVRVPAEVEVDLEGVADGSEPCVGGGAVRGLEGGISEMAAGVCEDDFFGESEQEEEGAAGEVLGGFGAVAKLFGEEGELEDGACDKVGEHGGEAGEIDEVLHGCSVSAIDVDDVAEGLEGVEADAEGEREMDGGNPVNGELERVAELGQGGEAEIPVFEESERGEVTGDGEGEGLFLAGRAGALFGQGLRRGVGLPGGPLVFGDDEAEEPVEGRGGEHEEDERGFGPSVESVSCEGEPQVPLSGRLVSQEEVAEEGEREEAVDENVGTEDHPRGGIQPAANARYLRGQMEVEIRGGMGLGVRLGSSKRAVSINELNT